MNCSLRTQFLPRSVTGLMMLGRDTRPSARSLPLHRHTGVELCLLCSGEVTWLVNGGRMRLVGGMASLMQPGVQHRGELDIIAPCDLYWVIFRPERFRIPLPASIRRRLTAGSPMILPDALRLRPLFDSMINACRTQPTGWQAGCEAQLVMLALETAGMASLPGSIRARQKSASMEEAASLLAANLEHPPSMRELARRMGMSHTRFHETFKAAIGMTPNDYLGRRRLAAAKQALAGTGEDITTLAYRLGYPSSQYFSMVFRKHTRRTPTQYRCEFSSKHA